MALLQPGYWPSTYWPEDYWDPSYWAEYDVSAVVDYTLSAGLAVFEVTSAPVTLTAAAASELPLKLWHPMANIPMLASLEGIGLDTATGGPAAPSYDKYGLLIASTDTPVTWPLPYQVRKVFSIDEAWSVSLDDETGASFVSLELSFADDDSYAQFTNKDLSSRAGNMIILRDGAGKLAWGYLGNALHGTTGIYVYLDPDLATSGWNEESGFNEADASYTFDVIKPCRAEGTIILEWTPTGTGAVDDLLLAGSNVLVQSPSGYAANVTNRVAVRWSTYTGLKQVSNRLAGKWTHGTTAAFDGNWFKSAATTLLLGGGSVSAKFKNFAIYRRWLLDTEL